MKPTNKNDLIFMANAITNSRYKLGVNETKIVLNFINLLNRDDSDFWTYTIPAKSFNIEHKKLKKAAKTLMSKPAIEIPKEYNPNLPPDEQEWLFAHWFADIEYKNNCIEASFSPKLKPYFLALKDSFVAYNLRYILPMQSQYSIRLYQMLKAEQWKKNTITYTVEYLRDVLLLKDKYKKYNDFKKFIIMQAEKELKDYSDIYFKYEEIKDGKKIIELTFNIFVNKNNQTHEINKKVAEFKKKIYKQYINQDIIEYKGEVYKCDDKGYLLNSEGLKIEPNKAIEIWQYIYNNQGNLITPTTDFEAVPDIGADSIIIEDMPDIGPDKNTLIEEEHIIPDNYTLTYEMEMEANLRCPMANISEIFEDFKLYYQSKQIKNKDWLAVWKRWLLNQKKYTNQAPKKPMSNNFELNDNRKEMVKDYIALADLELEFLKFKNHYLANGDMRVDWNSAWQNWAINHKQFKPKEQTKAMKEKQEYKWEFKKLKDISDKIEQWLDFTVKIDFIKLYVIPGVKEFSVKTNKEIIKIGWQYVMHPDYNTRQLLLFRVESDIGQALLEHRDEEIIDIEIL